MSRPLSALFAAALLCFTVSPATAELTPLGDAQVQAMQSLPRDPPPPALTRDSHYWVSNEDRLELFESHIRDKGGVLIGVGTDQNYLFAGWARSEVLFLMDFDEAISDLHEVYAIIFADTPDHTRFIEAWGAANVDALNAKITAKFSEPARQKRILRAYRTARGTVERRLRKVLKSFTKKGVRSFLDDAAQYAHVRDLWAKRRVVALRGDLTAKDTLQAIARVIREQGWTVGVFYPSNAEQYFPMLPQYRENIQALPANDQSVVIRTMGWGTLYGQADATYHYNVQPLKLFQTWAREGKAKSAGHMLRWRKPSDIVGFSTFEKLPGAEPTPGIAHKKTEAAALGSAPAAP